jgi:ATP-binding cassette, subfamily C (CFTR/MRP), member 1
MAHSKHFIKTVGGLITIRAFGWIPSHIQQNSRLLDESQRPSYLLVMLQQWLNLVLNMSVTCIALIVVTLATQLRTSAGFTGVALVSLMSFGEVAGILVRCYTELQTATAALSRLRRFEKTIPGEDDHVNYDSIISKDWPSAGGIEMQGVSVSYK